MNVHVKQNRYGPITGSGGGKGGGAPDEAKNSLLSKATAKILDVLGEGPMQGLLDGAKSIYFNNVPFMNADGSLNFDGVSWEQRIGEADQTPSSIIDTTESETGISVQVQKQIGPVVRTITEPDLDGFRVRMRIPALMEVQDDGDIKPYQVSFSIMWAPSGSGSYQHITGSPFTIHGKNNSDYYEDYEFDPPVDGPWDIKVERISEDETSSKKYSDTYWDAVVGIIRQKFIYPYTSYVAFKVLAEQFGSDIPDRSYDVGGRFIRVPSNYDPDTRTYTGFWDGTFKLAVSDNPAWVFFDLCTNDRYGPGYEDDEIDTASLYTVGKYCDELIPDGFGGTEPRYTVNICINTREEAFSLLNKMVSAFRGMVFWAGGQLVVAQDSPREPDVIVTPANTENGMFTYRSTSDASRKNTVYVTYNNPQLNDEPDIEVVDEPADILKRGVKTEELQSWGCRSQGQAHRHGEWYLYTNLHDTQSISYIAGMDHDNVQPGYIAAVHDPSKTSQRMGGGRIKAVNGQTFTLDRELQISANTQYQIMLTFDDRSVKYYDVDIKPTTGGYDTFTVAAQIVGTVEPGSVFIIYEKATGARLYRITSVSEDGGKRMVSGLLYNPSKYPYIERDKPLQAPPQDVLTQGQLKRPENFKYTIIRRTNPGAQKRTGILFSWTAPRNENRVTSYQLQFCENSITQSYRDIYRGKEPSFELNNVSGTTLKAARVRSLGPNGMFSPWQTISNIELTSRATPPDAPTVLSVQKDTTSRGLKIAWQVDKPDDFQYVEIWRANVSDINQAILIATETGTSYLDTNLNPAQAYYYWVRAKVRTDNPLAEYSIFTGPQSEQPNDYPPAVVVDNSITEQKLADGAVTAEKIADETITSTKFAATIKPVEIVTGLPTTGNVEGRTAVNTEDGKLYTYHNGAWGTPADVDWSDIPDNAITQNKIADAAVVASKLANQAVTHDKIAANSIYGDVIAANSITAAKMVVTDFTNRIPDNDMVDASSWENGAPGQWVFFSDGGGEVGFNSKGYVLHPYTAGEENYFGAFSSLPIPVIEGEEYYCEAQTYSDGMPNTWIRIHSYDKDGAEIVPNGWPIITPGQTQPGLHTWSTTFAPPAGTKTVILRTYCSRTGLTADVYVGGYSMRRKNGAELIVDGAVTADKLSAKSVTASKLTLIDTTNLILDSYMQDVALWSINARTDDIADLIISNEASDGMGAPACAYLPSTGINGQRSGVYYSKLIPVEEGVIHRAYCKLRVGSGFNGVPYLAENYYDKDGSWINEPGTAIFGQDFRANPSTGGQNVAPIEGQFQPVPAGLGVAYVRISLLVNWDSDWATDAAGYVAFSGLRVNQAASAELIVDGAITADKLAANSVTVGKVAAGAIGVNELAANAVTANKVAAGAISTDKLAVGGAANLIPNSDLSAGLTGYWYSAVNPATTFVDFITSGGTTTYVPLTGAVQIRQSDGETANNLRYVDFRPLKPGTASQDLLFDVVAGQKYEFSAYLYAHRCNAQMYIRWIDQTGATLSYSATSGWGNNNGDPQKQLSNYERAFIIAEAPAGAVAAGTFVRKLATLTGTSSYLWVTRLQFCAARPYQTEPSEWSNGAYTLIDNGGLVTGAVTADKIAANAITADSLASNSVIAGKIAANAVSAANINVGTLSAISANMGTITAGLARSADSKLQVDFNNTRILVLD